MRDEPGERWTLERARQFIAGAGADVNGVAVRVSARTEEDAAPALPPTASGTAADAEPTDTARLTRARLLRDGVAHLLATMRPHDTERLWPSEAFGETCDPVAVQHGSAGGVSVLARALRHWDGDGAGSAPVTRDALREGLRSAAYWTADRQDALPGNLPGLHFGRSGTAWALLDAARVLDDTALAARAAELALALPVEWPNPDVCHGAAGSGLAQLHFWRTTGDPRFLDRATRAADGLLAAARRTPEGIFWPVPEDFASALAGAWHYGFGHGVAGVGTFLLLAAEATGRSASSARPSRRVPRWPPPPAWGRGCPVAGRPRPPPLRLPGPRPALVQRFVRSGHLPGPALVGHRRAGRRSARAGGGRGPRRTGGPGYRFDLDLSRARGQRRIPSRRGRVDGRRTPPRRGRAAGRAPGGAGGPARRPSAGARGEPQDGARRVRGRPGWKPLAAAAHAVRRPPSVAARGRTRPP